MGVGPTELLWLTTRGRARKLQRLGRHAYEWPSKRFRSCRFVREALLPIGLVTFLVILGASRVSASSQAVSMGLGNVAPGSNVFVPVTPGELLRITASGNVHYDLADPSCFGVDPGGCVATDTDIPRPYSGWPAGALIGTFLSERGDPVAASFAPADVAIVIAPGDARELCLSINLSITEGSRGSFMIAALPVVLRPAPVRQAALGARAMVQHLLRRLAFSGSPQQVSEVLKTGSNVWLAKQLNPSSIDDSVALAEIEPKTARTTATAALPDWNLWERRLLQREVYTQRQVQEKMVLHWIDHFSVGDDKVGNPPMMSAYEDVLRRDALGNFKTLASDVARTAAMLLWLDNNGNDGSNPIANPPNENFARELMQLFILGPYKLRIDGSIINDAQGVPVPSFTESDVKHVARGLSGFWINYTNTPYDNPNTRFQTLFMPSKHTPGSESILGLSIAVPNDPSCVDHVVSALADSQSSAPFLVKELLQRLAVQQPSAKFVASIALVWQQQANNPHQIALVLQAIASDPEFYTVGYRSMPKEPVELFIQMARNMPIHLKRANYGAPLVGPGEALLFYLYQTLQEPYNPPSVFSFYLPGDKAQLINQASLLEREDNLNYMVTRLSVNPAYDTGLDLVQLRELIGSSQPSSVASYLLDAFVDSASPVLASSLRAYLGTGPVDDEHLQGAIWIVTTSPEFEVN